MEEAKSHARLTVKFQEQALSGRALMTKNIIDDGTIEACRRGESDAFRLLFEAYKDQVYSIAFCFFDGDEAIAKDVTQDVFLKLMTRISQFQNRSEFATWLYRIVSNACLDRKRALARFLSFSSSDKPEATDRGKSAEDRYLQRELEISVRKVIAGMRPKLRIAVLLKYFEDMSYDELAAALDCSKGTVASRLNRAHRILARKLSHLRAVALGE
jgi:RNA polymerase sigma-70 factor, ECF subfamily